MNPDNHAIKATFEQAKQGLIKALATTPDDRLNWTPSPTARSPLAAAAHSAGAIKNLHEMFQGRAFSVATTAEADEYFLRWEKDFTTREQVLELLDKVSTDFTAWLDTVEGEQWNSMVPLPFGMGELPLHVAVHFIAHHTNFHVAQIAYIQTIYGDRDWH